MADRTETAGSADSADSADLKQMTQAVTKFCDERDWDQFHTFKDVAIGLVTESAELLDLFRFKSEEQCREILADKSKRQQVSDELADILFFVLRFSERTGIDLPTALHEKMQKNRLKYPVEKARGSNKKYDEF